MSRRALLTVGHGTADEDRLTALLRDAGVGRVVDVRRFPGSRRLPHVARESLETWLPAAGVAYRWEPRLGGRRHVPAGGPPSPDTWWQVAAFRAYAGHMRTDTFREALTDLLAEADDGVPTAVLCSESLWWRCHRRMVADAATLLHDVPVLHLAHDGRTTPHRPADGARVTADGLVYDRPRDDDGPAARRAVDATTTRG